MEKVAQIAVSATANRFKYILVSPGKKIPAKTCPHKARLKAFWAAL
jgi:hypothetical protein